jgi:hypothetical protein
MRRIALRVACISLSTHSLLGDKIELYFISHSDQFPMNNLATIAIVNARLNPAIHLRTVRSVSTLANSGTPCLPFQIPLKSSGVNSRPEHLLPGLLPRGARDRCFAERPASADVRWRREGNLAALLPGMSQGVSIATRYWSFSHVGPQTYSDGDPGSPL